MKDTRRQRPLAALARVSVLALVVASFALAGAARPRQASALALQPGQADFNGDGYADLPIEVHGESVGAADGAGAVNVIYGSAAGLTSTGNQIWTQNDVGTAESLDDFGWEMDHADFNKDGYTDLVISAPGEALGDVLSAGVVHVLYGGAGGLTAANNQLWHQNQPGIADTVEGGDGFGTHLEGGDFNGDGYGDLAISVSEPIGDLRAAGAVHILYGGSGGLSSAGSQFWHQNSANILDSAEEGDHFGNYLAAGDFNRDGRDDLAIGVAGEDLGALTGAGAVNVLYGSATGLSSAGNQLWHQDQAGVAGAAETGDSFGQSLSPGDFNGDGYADLAAGAPGEAVGNIAEAGAVNVLYGGAGGLSGTGSQIWHRNQADIDGIAAADDAFGIVLSAGDFDGDGRADLAVGTPLEIRDNMRWYGAVNVLYGSASGIASARDWYFDKATLGGVKVEWERFGATLQSDDFNGDGRADLAISTPGEAVGTAYSTGTVRALYGTPSGLGPDGMQLWHQDVPGIQGSAEDGDGFGGFDF